MADHSDMTEVLTVLRVLNHPVRLSILCNLIERGEMTAGDIVAQEEGLASQSQTSQYLKLLKEEGLVRSRKEGQFVIYSLASDKIKELIATLHKLYCPARC
ncbi:MAG TPA: metalloregulator ArsR/SmtB family transcription factor [Alphaproteobacteria bacterium]|nr:helix-turn-helix transcriptional regulator [Alphaproteobacteria bacterium]HOO51749.1 metalloregulator ArsR/SmtB family transcription factor [Alphaproteobacteria bacterium]